MLDVMLTVLRGANGTYNCFADQGGLPHKSDACFPMHSDLSADGQHPMLGQVVVGIPVECVVEEVWVWWKWHLFGITTWTEMLKPGFRMTGGCYMQLVLRIRGL